LYGRVPYNSEFSKSRQVRKEATVARFLCDMGCLTTFLEADLSYQVIARKWRPKTFAELVGQTHVSQTLLNALHNSRLHHALLFTGPRGTGKTSSARILAKSLRCPNAKDFEPCHECKECQDVAKGRSIDVIEIDGASNNGVDAIRELRETVGYMPSSGSYKLYIIDEVHMLSTSAFNALLKTLEEPPPHVIFVMATTEVHKIPHTILSRCQRFDFRRISMKNISARLSEICQADGVEADEEALWLVARQGDGSMRDSQSLLDQVITFTEGHVTRDKAVHILGLTDRSLLLESVQALVERNTKAIVQIIERIFTAGYEPNIFMQDLLEELRHLLLIKITKGQLGTIVDLPDSEIIHLQKLAETLSEEDIHLLFDMALKGSSDLLRAQDTRVVLEMILLRMSSAPRVVQLLAMDKTFAIDKTSATANSQLKAPVSKSTSLRSTPLSMSTGKSQTAAVHTNESTITKPLPVVHTNISSSESKWMELIKNIQQTDPRLSAKLEYSCLLEIDDKMIKLGVPDKRKFLLGQIEDKEFQKKLLNHIGSFWGPGYTVKVDLVSSEGKKKNFKTIEELNKEGQAKVIREQVANHPFVRSAQKIFQSQIKEIKEVP